MIDAPMASRGSPAFLAPKLCPYGIGLRECHLVAILQIEWTVSRLNVDPDQHGLELHGTAWLEMHGI